MADRSTWRRRISLTVASGLCGLVLMLAAWWYYGRQRDAIEASASGQLAAIAETKAAQIANWRSERLGDGQVLASAPVIALARRVLSRSSGGRGDSAPLVELLQHMAGAFHYADAALLDMQGKPRLEVNPDGHYPDPPPGLLHDAEVSGKVLLSDLYLDGASKPRISMVVPVPGAGAIVMGIDPETFLYPTLRSWPTVYQTGEVALARREGAHGIFYLSNLKGAPGRILRDHRTISPEAEASIHPYSTSFAFRSKDYSGVALLGAYHQVPGTPWIVISKLDVAEITRPLRRLAIGIALIIALILTLNTAGVVLIWRTRELRFYRGREEWFRRISNDTPAYLWTVDAAGELAFINQRWAKFRGVDENNLAAIDIDSIHPEDRQRVLENFHRTLDAREDFHDEFRILRHDNTYRWVVGDALPRFGPDGEFLGYAGAFTDITGRRVAEQNLREANQALAAELDERARSEHQIQALTARLIDAQEQERTRLARELHDDVSQQIAAVSIATSNLKKQIPRAPDAALDQATRIQEKLIVLADSLRRMSHQLHPTVLEHVSLAAAIGNYCKEYAALTSHRIDCQVEGHFEDVPPATALCVYRVVQEALQNSIKHSQTSQASVSLIRSDGTLKLAVSDRGVGITSGPTTGLGLVSIRERARLVGGSVEVNSRPGEGFTLTLTVPSSHIANA